MKFKLFTLALYLCPAYMEAMQTVPINKDTVRRAIEKNDLIYLASVIPHLSQDHKDDFLLHASYENRPNAIRLFLNGGANPWFTKPYHFGGLTALHTAALDGALDAVKILIPIVGKDFKDGRDRTALQAAKGKLTFITSPEYLALVADYRKFYEQLLNLSITVAYLESLEQ